MSSITTAPALRAGDVGSLTWGKYPRKDNLVWRELYQRQARSSLMRDHVCGEFIAGLRELGIDESGIPDLDEVNAILQKQTGWRVTPICETVGSVSIFEMLAGKRFPAISKIRPREQIRYALSPDLWHDIFGHVPMLMNPAFARYLEIFGEMGLEAAKRGKSKHIARVFFYIVEFGLVRAPHGFNFLGAAVCSSEAEQRNCSDNSGSRKLRFDLVRVMRTRTRYEGLQPTYFVIDGLDQIGAILARPDLMRIVDEASKLPDLEPDQIATGDTSAL